MKFKIAEASLDPVLNQLLRSGTSIGANVHKAQCAITKKDFINRLHISLKKLRNQNIGLAYFLKPIF